MADSKAIPDYQDNLARLEQLGNLGRGWYGKDQGETPTKRAITAAAGLLDVLATIGAQQPNVYPTMAGGISLEWTGASLEFNADGTSEAWAEGRERRASDAG